MKKNNLIFLGFILFIVACHRSASIDITPYNVNPEADKYFKQAQLLLPYFNKDSTRKSIALIDKALSIDSLNPDYYGAKAKLFSELGLLDSALLIQAAADKIGAVNGDYLFQLGLFQAAKGKKEEAHETFGRSNLYLKEVLKKYPDSLGALIIQQAANSLYNNNDTLFMQDIKSIRARFPNRLMEIEMTRRLKPHYLIEQLKQIEDESLQTLSVKIDSELMKQEKKK